MKKDFDAERRAFKEELKALCNKHQMGIISSFERKDFTTKNDVDLAASSFVYMSSQHDMAGHIGGLIEKYPDVAHILLVNQVLGLGLKTQPDSASQTAKQPDTRQAPKPEPELAAKLKGAKVIEIDIDNPDAAALLEILQRMSKAA